LRQYKNKPVIVVELMCLFFGVAKVTNFIGSDGGADALVRLGDSYRSIISDAALLVKGTVNGGILTAAITGVLGSVRSSGVWFERVDASASVGVSVNIDSGRAIGTAACILSVVTSSDEAVVLFF
jgi:hypothetical protein